MPYAFPTRLFSPGQMRLQIVGASQSGGRSLSGIAQNAELSGGGFWAVEFGDVSLTTPAKVLAWRRLSAALAGGGTSVDVLIADRRHQPPGIVVEPSIGLDTWVEDDFWVTPEVLGPVGVMILPGWEMRSTVISFGWTGQPLVGGELFSVQDSTTWAHRLHRITRIIGNDGTGYTAEVRPPLRVTGYGGQPMNFNSPRCTMRLDGDMAEPLEMLRTARAAVRFVEDFPPAASGTS
jgi:hypothetical protein